MEARLLRGWKTLAALAALLAVAAVLAACGGNDGAGSGGDSATPPSAEAERGGGASGEGPGSSGEQGSAGEPGSPGDDGSAEGGQPQEEPARGGEASIEGFGSEASGGDREAIESAFRTYMTALAEEDYATACSLLSQRARQGIGQLAPPKLRRKGCTATLPALLTPTAKAIAREQAGGEVTKVRVEGDDAFVIFRAPGAKLYQMTMVREEGGWKAGLLAASVLVPDL